MASVVKGPQIENTKQINEMKRAMSHLHSQYLWNQKEKIPRLPGPVCEVGQEHAVEGQGVHGDVRPLGQGGHVLDDRVQVVEAGDRRKHAVHYARPKQPRNNKNNNINKTQYL